MISVCLIAGLGNRMFCYAFAQGLKAKGYDVYIDEESFTPRSSMTFEDVHFERIFPNIDFKKTPKGKFSFCCIPGIKGGVLRRVSNLLSSSKYIKEPSFENILDIDKVISPNCCFIGQWQSEKYFKDAEAEVRRQFEFLPFDEEKNIELTKKMTQEESVAIHIRKGKDYSIPFFSHTCTAEYYINAISYVKQKLNNPVFYVFTDNKEWVDNNLHDLDYTLVDWNPTSGPKNFRDMQLMACAKHNIIANSSYSWWGAYLNSNPDKIVIAPAQWFSPDVEGYKHNNIVPDNWIKF